MFHKVWRQKSILNVLSPFKTIKNILKPIKAEMCVCDILLQINTTCLYMCREYTTIFLSLFCLPRLHLFDHKYSKNSKTVTCFVCGYMFKCNSSIITPVFSVTWSSEIIQILTFQMAPAERHKAGGDVVVHVLTTAEVFFPIIPCKDRHSKCF